MIDDVHGNVYVGASDGKLYQLGIPNGAVRATRTVAAGASVIGLLRQPLDITDLSTSSLVAADELTVIARYCAPFSTRGRVRP